MRGRVARLLVGLVVGVSAAAAAVDAQAPAASPSTRVTDLDGREVLPFAVEGARAYALFFVRPGCPVSNRAAPELARLRDEFASRGVAMWLVYPGRQSPNEIRQHVQEFGHRLTPLRDPAMRLVDLTGVGVTPEAAIFDASRRLVYRGRLDDRYLDLGRARREPTVRDAHDVLAALLAGRPVPYASRPGVGCFIEDLR